MRGSSRWFRFMVPPYRGREPWNHANHVVPGTTSGTTGNHENHSPHSAAKDSRKLSKTLEKLGGVFV
jgi:hypothetical protein